MSSPEAIKAAGQVLAQARVDVAAMTPREQAEAAHVPGGPSIEQLEQRIREQRGMDVDEVTA